MGYHSKDVVNIVISVVKECVCTHSKNELKPRLRTGCQK